MFVPRLSDVRNDNGVCCLVITEAVRDVCQPQFAHSHAVLRTVRQGNIIPPTLVGYRYLNPLQASDRHTVTNFLLFCLTDTSLNFGGPSLQMCGTCVCKGSVHPNYKQIIFPLLLSMVSHAHFSSLHAQLSLKLLQGFGHESIWKVSQWLHNNNNNPHEAAQFLWMLLMSYPVG